MIINEFLKYLFVGFTAFLADFSSLLIGTKFFHINYLISAAFGFFIGVIVNYQLSIRWVFKYRVLGNKSLEFFYFTVIGIIGLVLNEIFIFGFTQLLNGKYLLAKLPTTILVFLWNFGARKFFLFRKGNNE